MPQKKYDFGELEAKPQREQNFDFGALEAPATRDFRQVQKPIRPLGPARPPTEAEGFNPSLKTFLDVPLDIGIGIEQAAGIEPMHPVKSLLEKLPSPKTNLLDLGKDAAGSFARIPAAIGEAVQSGANALRKGNVPEAAQAVGRGAALGEVAKGGINAAIKGTTRVLGEVLPTTERANPMFAEIREKGANVPVNLGAVQPEAARAFELKTAGSGPLPTALSEYLKRQKPIKAKFGGQRVDMAPDPMMLPEAMDRYSAAGRQSSLEASATPPVMQAQLGQFAKMLREANRDAAVKAGIGDVFDAAMKEYRRAKTIEDALDVVKKYAPKAIIGTGLGYELWKSH